MLSSTDLLREAVADIKRRETQQLVLVNGPPGAGKDEVGRLFSEFYRGTVYVAKFAKRLKEMTHLAYGCSHPHDHFESSKNVKTPFFLGLTPREAYIGMSENYMKVMHGSDIFGRILLQDLIQNAKDADVIVITDSGFLEEAEPIIEHFGERNTRLVRLTRPGTSYDGDSRGYLKLDLPGADIDNNGTILDLAKRLAETIDGFEIDYSVEVQLPAGTGLMWFEQGRARPTFEQAAAVAEQLRQGNFAQRAIRIRTGKDTIVRLIMPGDAPTLELL